MANQQLPAPPAESGNTKGLEGLATVQSDRSQSSFDPFLPKVPSLGVSPGHFKPSVGVANSSPAHHQLHPHFPFHPSFIRTNPSMNSFHPSMIPTKVSANPMRPCHQQMPHPVSGGYCGVSPIDGLVASHPRAILRPQAYLGEARQRAPVPPHQILPGPPVGHFLPPPSRLAPQDHMLRYMEEMALRSQSSGFPPAGLREPFVNRGMSVPYLVPPFYPKSFPPCHFSPFQLPPNATGAPLVKTSPGSTYLRPYKADLKAAKSRRAFRDSDSAYSGSSTPEGEDDEDFSFASDNDSKESDADDLYDESDSDYEYKSRGRKASAKSRLRSTGAARKARPSDDSTGDIWPASLHRARNHHRATRISRKKRAQVSSRSSDTETSTFKVSNSNNPTRSGRRRVAQYVDSFGEFTSSDFDTSSENDVSQQKSHASDSAQPALPYPYNQGIDRVLGYKLSTQTDEYHVYPHSGYDPVVTPKEWLLLIKWTNLSHLHNSFEDPADLEGVLGARKVENFVKKMKMIALQRTRMTEDDIEQQNIAFELQKQIDMDSLIPEHIVAHTCVSSRASEADSPASSSPSSPRAEKLSPALTPPAQTDDPVKPPSSDFSSPCAHADLPLGEPPPPASPHVKDDVAESRSPAKDDIRHRRSPSLENSTLKESLDPTKQEPPPDQAEENKPDHSSPRVSSLTNGSDGQGSGTPKSFEYFVKWSSCAYDQCTWETHAFLVENNFQSFIDKYWSTVSRLSGKLSARLPLHQHALSRTSFEPYTATPWYLETTQETLLRDYQIYGINWIISRMKKGFSVLLADEMGLGKTIQAIATIGHIIYSELIHGPFLIITPQSTADNWYAEFKRWLPNVNVVVYHGNPKAREILTEYELCQIEAQPYQPGGADIDSRSVGYRIPASSNRTRHRFDICIATLSILTSPDDLYTLRNIRWYLMITDEAHLLKNRNSVRFNEWNQFNTRYRLLLSGTPLHNNLEEMWALLHFLNPVEYNDLGHFKSKYSEVEKIDSIGDLKQQQLATLQNELKEIVLRRVKKDVEKSLSKKVERILRIELSPKQVACCEAILGRNFEVLAKTSGVSQSCLKNICMELKKTCNHTMLLQSDQELLEMEAKASQSAQARAEWNKQLIHSSGKLVFLDKFLPYLKEKGHRLLIFSQMVRMLNILSKYLTMKQYKHQRLDGTMNREMRKKAMDHFNAPDSDDFCFLLSTKAGGLGINLTSADTVIIYDSDWNPQNDLQAEARAHRIGQTKIVHIYRLVTKNTIEQRILERAKAKLVLDTLVIQGLNQKAPVVPNQDSLSLLQSRQGQSTGFSKEELAKILKFGASKLWRVDDYAFSYEAEGVNLEEILAQAAENEDYCTGAADDLMSSYANISDFQYEAPEEENLDDDDFWEKTIPKEARVQQNELESLAERRCRQKLQSPPVKKSDSDDLPELQSSTSSDDQKRKRPRKKPKVKQSKPASKRAKSTAK